jgi:hypothetical protein
VKAVLRFGLGALLSLSLLAAVSSCGGTGAARQAGARGGAADSRGAGAGEASARPFAGKMIYVVVALCDNVNQGIVPVAAHLGDGEDPAGNLYWGARFGVETFFRSRPEWRLVSEVKNPGPKVLERLVFKHRRADAYLVADAYRGSEIKQATADFLSAASGNSEETVTVGAETYGLSRGAASHLVAYVGHNGLMDFRLAAYPKRRDEARRDAVILACASKNYFGDALREAGANPLLWTTNLMAPEAYVLDAAVGGWLAGDSGEQVRQRAARAYHSYQNCGLRAAQRLFANGW